MRSLNIPPHLKHVAIRPTIPTKNTTAKLQQNHLFTTEPEVNQYEVPHWLYIEICTASRGFLAIAWLLFVYQPD